MKRYWFSLIVLVAIALLSSAAAEKPAPSARNSIGMAFVRMAPGTFLMGTAEPIPDAMLDTAHVMSRRPAQGDFDEVPAHKVTISKSFLIEATEVTIEQYSRFRPGYRGNPAFAPYASGVSWNDATGFCKWLSEKERKSYRLPTEAEWEYASRAGSKEIKNLQSGPAEWCHDWYGLYSSRDQTDPVGRASGIAKVVRGGGLDYRKAAENGTNLFPALLPYFSRPANRASMAPAFESGAGNIGFRVVEAAMPATEPLPYDPPFFQSAVKQTAPDTERGPDPNKPYYRVRRLFPNLGERSMRAVGPKVGLAPGLGIHYHNSAIQVCTNGDVIAAYYNTPANEDDPDQSILSMRLRYGAEDWDMPEPWPDFADAADAAPVFWNERGTLWMFFGSPRLIGAQPFQYMTSRDNGATWSEVRFPYPRGPLGDYTPQPINSVVRAADGTIYLPVDGKGSTSVLFATKDDGKSWFDTGGRTAGRHTTLVLGKDGSLIGIGGKNSNIDGKMPVAVSSDGGKTYVKSATQFLPLGSGQRPSVIRLASGRLFFVADYIIHKGPAPAPKRDGAFVAISEDDGKTWKSRELPNISTVGYVTATQGPDGIIRIATSHNNPLDTNIDLNEAWVMEGGPERAAGAVREAKKSSENYPNGKLKCQWSGGVSEDGRYLLEGPQIFYYEDGRKQWETTFRAGRKIGTETYWTRDGRKRWERIHDADGGWLWRVYSESGDLQAESRWKGKDLLAIAP